MPVLQFVVESANQQVIPCAYLRRRSLALQATNPIGAQIVSRLAQEGGRRSSSVTNRSRQAAEALVSSLAPRHHLVAEASVTDSDCLARLAGQIEKRFGGWIS
jgi:3-oxoacyl-[acyl-carrier protein] reductase